VYISVRLILHLLIRQFAQFVTSFYPEKRFVCLIRQLQFRFRCLSTLYVWEFKQIKDLYLRIVAPPNLLIEFIHEVRSATRLPIVRTRKSL